MTTERPAPLTIELEGASPEESRALTLELAQFLQRSGQGAFKAELAHSGEGAEGKKGDWFTLAATFLTAGGATAIANVLMAWVRSKNRKTPLKVNFSDGTGRAVSIDAGHASQADRDFALKLAELAGIGRAPAPGVEPKP
jgi:hypothetical protein